MKGMSWGVGIGVFGTCMLLVSWYAYELWKRMSNSEYARKRRGKPADE